MHLGLDLALLEPGGERRRFEHLADEVGELLRVVRASLGEERAPLGDDVACGAAADEPDVRGRSSSTRPSLKSAIAFAAAAIADRPSSGYMPAWAARPWNLTSIECAYGAPRITSPIGAAWS